MSLVARFREHWNEEGYPGAGCRVAVACSGGVDSLVLLHLLRFSAGDLGIRALVAHFDHRMRPGSSADKEWLAGLSGAWRVPIRTDAAEDPPRNEAAARGLRYGFLTRLLREGEADAVVTAHHADDQVETVLFRVLRGTGVRGLRGIPSSRRPGILRPLLPFRRSEIEAYAADHHLRPRLDPTNRSLRFARNRIRHRLLPILEEVHPGAREGILRVSRNARRVVEALDALLEPHLDRAVISVADSAATDAPEPSSASDATTGNDGRAQGAPRAEIVLDRGVLLDYSHALRTELLRGASAAAGIRLNEAGTALAMQFITGGSRGGLDLGGGVRIRSQGDRIILVRGEAAARPESAPSDPGA